MSTKQTEFFRARMTANTNGEQPYSVQPWEVCCESHKRIYVDTCASYLIEELEGQWRCPECAKFDWKANSALRKALTHPSFSHTTITGIYRHRGAVYHKDNTSPSGVRSAQVGFDANNPEVLQLVKKLTGTPNIGPQSGNLASR